MSGTSKEALEAALEADPYDASAFLVYADWLLEREEPLGELIRVQHALTVTPGDVSLEKREAELRKLVAPQLRRENAKWALGFPRELHLVWLTDEMLAAAVECLSTPTGRFVEKLALSDYVQPRQQALLHSLARLPRLTHLELGNQLELLNGTRQMSRQLLEIAADAAGRLTHLTLKATFAASVLSELPLLPSLQRLTLAGTRLQAEDPAALRLARGRVPATCVLRLEHSSNSYAMEDAAREAWPFELPIPEGSGLLVEAPPQHRGRYLSVRPSQLQRIGHDPACDLSLPECGLRGVEAVLDAEVLRPPGETDTAPKKLEPGQLMRLGQAVLRYCADLKKSRAALRG